MSIGRVGSQRGCRRLSILHFQRVFLRSHVVVQIQPPQFHQAFGQAIRPPSAEHAGAAFNRKLVVVVVVMVAVVVAVVVTTAVAIASHCPVLLLLSLVLSAEFALAARTLLFTPKQQRVFVMQNVCCALSRSRPESRKAGFCVPSWLGPAEEHNGSFCTAAVTDNSSPRRAFTLSV